MQPDAATRPDNPAAPSGSAAGSRELAALSWRRALELTAPITDHPSRTLPLVVDRLAERFAEAPALLGEAATLSFAGLAERAARYARWALDRRLGAGEVVALLLPNCPDYLAIWLGITRVGGVAALVNTNLVGDALRHAIDIVAPRHAIVAVSHAEAFAAVQPHIARPVEAWAHGGEAAGWPRIDRAIAALDPTPPGPAPGARAPQIGDRALYIYTSGTTGLPKAAAVSHYRIMQWSHWFAGMIEAQPADRMYNCLPMYHSVGGVVATCAPLVAGASVVLRERFSASRFWDDVADSGCTLFQYIGELCRYLVNSAPQPRERAHRLRLACGNGLRAEVWGPFQERFQIPRIIEFYSSTEGNFALYNCEGKAGAIGRIPPFLQHRLPVVLVKVDADTGEPLRDAAGLCRRCAADEPGEAIGRLPEAAAGPAGRFDGYTDRAASERKVLRDVFAAGDAWYRSGDLMRRDRAGYFYFVDRLGDTFRWKGENVSTTEVEAVLAAAPGVVEAVVYGVPVPGAEGRAGMAALVADAGFSLDGFARHVAARLPDYARPLFLRLCSSIAATGTFKPQKQALAGEGYDPAAIAEPLWVYDREQGRFVVLDASRCRRITAGELRL